jgi:hypothetical protein
MAALFSGPSPGPPGNGTESMMNGSRAEATMNGSKADVQKHKNLEIVPDTAFAEGATSARYHLSRSRARRPLGVLKF